MLTDVQVLQASPDPGASTATLLRDDRILRVMIVRNEIPPALVEWAERSFPERGTLALGTAALCALIGIRWGLLAAGLPSPEPLFRTMTTDAED